jgi:endonuclease/exonuclease/phosphatase family metal-dependent hydrolase
MSISHVLVLVVAALVASPAAAFSIREVHEAIKEIPTPYNSLKVAAFNIQVFGTTKMSNPAVVAVLKDILVRYDICLIQEIRDATDTAIHQLLDEVNSMGVGTWQMMLSDRLGRTTSKEQYAFFYKTSTVGVVNFYQWPDTTDIFEREPYIVRFRASSYAVGEFGFLGIHTKPDDAVNEINALVDVYDSVSSMWGLTDFILSGDFNAGCTYVTSADWANIRLRTDSRFMWVIGDSIDTTASSTNCPYDRLVLAGSKMQGAYISGSAVPFNYETAYGISNTLALDVSDHYPVEMLLD